MAHYCLAALLTLCSSVLCAGTVYQWSDEEGRVHYGSQPPQGVSASVVRPQSNTVSKPKASAPSPPTAPSVQALQKEADALAQAEAAKEQLERQTYCQNLRTDLARLENNPRVMMQENGQPRRLTEDERQARILELTQRIELDCN